VSVVTGSPRRVVEALPAVESSASVIVIGAGMAGLCAAVELVEAGCHVTVLEAQHRVGGRVRTRRDFADGLYVEEGATRFPDVHHLTTHYLKRFALPLINFDRPDMGHTLRIMGHDVQQRPRLQGGGSQDAWPAELPLHPHERELTLEGLTDLYVAPLLTEIGDPLAQGWPSADLRARFDSMGYADLLRSGGASEGAIRALSLGFHVGEGPNSMSALWWLEAMALDAEARGAVKVEGGNDQFAEAFARLLSGRIRLGRVARRVVDDGSGVTVHVDSPVRPETYRADYAISTIPLPLLLDVHFEPELDAQRREAIAAVPYASLSRVALQCRERFWLELDHSGFEATDEEIAEVWDLTVGEPGTRGVLVAYSGGNEARRVTAMPAEERITYTVERLEPLLPGLVDHVEGGASICWDSEPWARGGGAWFRPGQSVLRPVLARPHGRVHFAGEAISHWPGWVQGSLESARRTATEVLERSTGTDAWGSSSSGPESPA
jgi:monoamine oxidase